MPEIVPELHWEDGVLLRPQHLQAYQRHCHGLISQLALARTFGFGARSLKVRADSIGNWIFELESCEIVMPDGSLVIAGQTAVVPPLEFRHMELDAPQLDVWLAIPLLNPKAANVERPGSADGPVGRRYVATQAELADENSGTNAQPIALRHLNGRLFVGQRPPPGHVTLKLAELKKVVTEGEEGRRYELSRNYVPACLNVEASPQLFTIVKDVLDRVEEKNAELLASLRGVKTLLTGESMERPATLLKLQATNSVLPVLRQLSAQPEMHPFDLYLQLCRLVGDLAIFGDDWEPPRLVIYNHTDPLRAFLDIKRVVLELLERAVATSIERRAFVKAPTEGVWEVEVPPAFMGRGVELFLGIDTKLQAADVAPLVAGGRTVLASPEDLGEVRRRRIEGIPCRHDPTVHPSLRDREGLVFLRLHSDSPFWPSVESTGRLQLARHAAAAELEQFYLYALGLETGGGPN